MELKIRKVLQLISRVHLTISSAAWNILKMVEVLQFMLLPYICLKTALLVTLVCLLCKENGEV